MRNETSHRPDRPPQPASTIRTTPATSAYRASPGRRQVAWSSLPWPARLFRVAHVAWGIAQLGALAAIWLRALQRRRDRPVAAAVAFLLLEGAALVAGRGDCPMGPWQRRLGDPVPMFELVLPPRAARAAVPLLAGLSVAGIAALLLRRPPRPDRA